MTFWSAVLRSILGVLSLSVCACVFGQAPIATCSDNPATDTTTCRIDNPLVTQRITEYDGRFHPESFLATGNCNIFSCNQHFGVQLPGIFLSRGDLVTVDADGCAQTGGSGATWKRYVNPQGNNADRLYHGLVGALNAIEPDNTTMPSPIRIQDIRRQPFWIPAAQPLRLGYEDDDYRDNGYWGHDNGDPEQCNLDGSHGFGGNAFVTITIQHNAPPPPNAPPAPWDIVSADPALSAPFDFNALLFNPRWGWQTAVVSAPLNFDNCSSPSACTGQVVTRDEPDTFRFPFTCLPGSPDGAHGHLNWMVVTYRGRIFWESHSPSLFGDDDYNFLFNSLITNGFPSGVTATNPQQLLLEFQARETIDHFITPFWNDFHHAVDDNDNEAHIKVDNKEAVVMGLMGLDRVHGSGSEIHPVFVLAIHTNLSAVDDTWAIFARNYGNEGWCSDNMHYANVNTVTLQLPRTILAPATAQATVAPGTLFLASDNPFFDIAPNQNVDIFSAPNQDTLVTFHLPSPPADGDDGARIHGELHLNWIGSLAPVAPAAPQSATLPTLERAPIAQASGTLDPDGLPEARLAELWSQLSPAQQATYRAMLPVVAPASPDSFLLTPNVLSAAPPRSAAPPALTEAPDTRQRGHREQVLQSFCGAMNGQAPADLGTCANFAPFTQLTLSRAPNAAGWFNNDVGVTLTPINVSGKGIDHTEYSFDNLTWVRYVGTFVVGEGVFTIFYRSQDTAGTLETARSAVVKVDKTPPVIRGSRAPAANAFGWNNSDVTVSFSCTDNLSGVAAISPSGPTILSQEGANQQIGGSCQDVAGNAASTVVGGINIDKTPPLLTAVLNPPPNAAGWNKTDVTVTFIANDALSGVASVTSPITVSSEGRGQVVLGAAADRAGNVSHLAVTVNLDKTPPEIFNQFDPVSHDVVLQARDSLSGVPSGVIPPSSVTKRGGVELRTYNVLDAAGNSLVVKERVRRSEEEHEVSVEIVGLEYNGVALRPAENRQKFEWSADSRGQLRHLVEEVEIDAGERSHRVEEGETDEEKRRHPAEEVETDDEPDLRALFNARTNETVIIKGRTRTVRPGLVLLRMATNKGALVAEF